MTGVELILPFRAVSVYVPAAASGCPVGHPAFDVVLVQITVEEKTCPGLNVLTAGWPPGAQSSEDQTRVAPLITSSVIAARPMSRLHAKVPVLVTETVRCGLAPAAYDEASVNAVTLMSASWQAVTAGGVALLLGVVDTEAVGSGEGDGVVTGVCDADTLGEVDADGPAAFLPPPTPVSRSQAPTTSSSTTTRTTARRNQYAPDGSEPTGCRNDPTAAA